MAANSAAYIVELLHNLNILSISRLGIVNAAETISSILEPSVYTPCLTKSCAKLFQSELCQIFVNFNNLWQVDEKMAKIICHINISHLTSLISSQYLVKQKSAKFYITLKFQLINCCTEIHFIEPGVKVNGT